MRARVGYGMNIYTIYYYLDTGYLACPNEVFTRM